MVCLPWDGCAHLHHRCFSRFANISHSRSLEINSILGTWHMLKQTDSQTTMKHERFGMRLLGSVTAVTTVRPEALCFLE